MSKRKDKRQRRMEKIKAQIGAETAQTAPVHEGAHGWDNIYHKGVITSGAGSATETPHGRGSSTENPLAKVRSLKWIMVADFNIIPRYLVEQITDRQYTIEDFYSIGNVLQADPLQQVYVLLNDDRLVKGFLWFHVIPFTRSIFVNAFSVDPEYRDGEGGPLRYAVELLKSIYDRLKLTGSIRFTTTFPEYYEKHGMRKSKFVSMEV
ncbi:MAG: GNAT family N-acetyltransferase [Syntrophales bacterium]|nr:GNAT family N-acetyltransferase [Syntrophales bacterium]